MTVAADPYVAVTDAAIRAEASTIGQALRVWSDQCGVDPQEFARYFTVRVQRRFEGTVLHTRVLPVLRGDPPPWKVKPVVL